MLGFGHYTADDTASALKQRDYKDATDLAVIPFVKAKRAMSNTDDDRWEATETAPTLNAFDNGGESRATVLMPLIFDGTRHDDFRMDTEIVPTLKQRMGTGGGQVPMVAEPVVATTMAVRRLTPLECERLMGFPDDHTRWTDEGKEQADTHRYKQCGNAVASPVARWVGQHVRRVL